MQPIVLLCFALVLLGLLPVSDAIAATARLSSEAGEAAEVYWEEDGEAGAFRLGRDGTTEATLDLSVDGTALWESTATTPLSVKGSMEVLGTLTADGDVILASGDLSVTGNIDVTGTVDGVDVAGFKADFDDLEASTVTLDGNQTISGSKTFSTSLEVVGDVSVSGDVDGVHVAGLKADFDSLEANTVTLDGTQTISGSKTFSTGLDVVGDISVSGAVDGVDVAQLKTDFDELNNTVSATSVGSDVVTVSDDQVVSGQKTFEATVIASAGVNATDDIVTSGALNGSRLILNSQVTTATYLHNWFYEASTPYFLLSATVSSTAGNCRDFEIANPFVSATSIVMYNVLNGVCGTAELGVTVTLAWEDGNVKPTLCTYTLAGDSICSTSNFEYVVAFYVLG